MPAVLQSYFEWPTLPFSVLLCLVTAYWLLMIVSGIGLDLFDFDLEAGVDVDGHATIFDWGMIGLKWFNLGEVPLMVWLSAFIAPAWLMSATFDRGLVDPTTWDLATAILRNTGIGLLAAKAITQPLRGVLKTREPNQVRDMLGRQCIITTTEATDAFGQARCQQDGAPLLLNVQTSGDTLPQGETVQIVDYIPESRTYIVEPIGTPDSAPAAPLKDS